MSDEHHTNSNSSFQDGKITLTDKCFCFKLNLLLLKTNPRSHSQSAQIQAGEVWFFFKNLFVDT